MGKSKDSSVRALDWLVEQGVDVAAVVAPDQTALERSARGHGLPLVSEAELYADPPGDVDVVVSFLFWNLIREPLISRGRAAAGAAVLQLSAAGHAEARPSGVLGPARRATHRSRLLGGVLARM